jgi:Acetyltransferase (GNAT) family
MINYQIEEKLAIEEFRDVLVRSTLGERRPIDDPERLGKMLEYGNLIITARENGKLIGIARSLTDFLFCTYLSDLAVNEAYQKMGIGNWRRHKLFSSCCRRPQPLLIIRKLG